VPRDNLNLLLRVRKEEIRVYLPLKELPIKYIRKYISYFNKYVIGVVDQFELKKIKTLIFVVLFYLQLPCLCKFELSKY
jgi:hypothetical protein